MADDFSKANLARASMRSHADPLSQATTSLLRWHIADATPAEDELAVEEPLEVRVRLGEHPYATETIAVIMRTPGADEELAAGFLYSEGLIASHADLKGFSTGLDDDGLPSPNLLDILETSGTHASSLAERVRAGGISRAFAVNASCGVCGRNSVTAVCAAFPPLAPMPAMTSTETLYSLPDHLRAGQRVFSSTGGLHAAGLFALDGTLLALREDVGRHNAVDKLIGRALLDSALPLRDRLLLVSGRLSFEIVQKVVSAGIPLVAAVSAPSSLAVDLARESGVTLVGFLRGASMNVYTHPERISRATPA
jgi:FdhD protein